MTNAFVNTISIQPYNVTLTIHQRHTNTWAVGMHIISTNTLIQTIRMGDTISQILIPPVKYYFKIVLIFHTKMYTRSI